MKHFEARARQRVNSFLAMILSMLGFVGITACGNIAGGENPAEYGTPYVKYQIKGKVMNKADQPLDDIRVCISIPTFDGDAASVYQKYDTVYTDHEGVFIYDHQTFPFGNKILTVLAEDVAQPVRYTETEEDLEFTTADFQGGKGWFQGSAQKYVTIVMPEKASNH